MTALHTHIRSRQRQRGAALLTAMVVVALIATFAAAMVAQQSRAVRVEDAVRARAKAAWVLGGALDWALVTLSESARLRQASEPVDHLGQRWAVPMLEARLSTFLGSQRDDEDPHALLSGSIVDAQSRYDLTRLIGASGKTLAAEVAVLERLCQTVGVSPESAGLIAKGLRGSTTQGDASPLQPQEVRQLAWFGVDAATIAALAPYVVVLPTPEPVNVNTASREVLAALIENMDLGTAEQLVQVRQSTPFVSVQAFAAQLPEFAVPLDQISVSSDFFEVRNRLRLSSRVLEQRALVHRGADGQVSVVSLERGAAANGARP
jgi:general secretion pathway protein K